ncbi:uncharacterized protein PHACADRAFT_181691 [Phanerochaete carnosa HHB-10118-sp]|uniref:Uncharacterized protein n=1 Tax=Phanerochaete carnosa (strain HHB-10118-sp) TaxID=650164 RepID=K5WJY1_PHACS|nr:uncharacterized protein PHACADRAFT_181691 [Phanerochaete carnosa HHB-10118-sp]EKM59720.1 hypothetical protein PHACADRAFT_181691 [Phanerochaete carnosa HHB-10118-sp]
MSLSSVQTYRSIVREINRATHAACQAIAPRPTRNPAIASNFRRLFEHGKGGEPFAYDMQNALTFMHSQRMHKALLDRYNPLHDLTTEEQIKATARRVGLDMPISGGNKDN